MFKSILLIISIIVSQNHLFAERMLYGDYVYSANNTNKPFCLIINVINNGIGSCSASFIETKKYYRFITAKHCLEKENILSLLSCGNMNPISLQETDDFQIKINAGIEDDSLVIPIAEGQNYLEITRYGKDLGIININKRALKKKDRTFYKFIKEYAKKLKYKLSFPKQEDLDFIRKKSEDLNVKERDCFVLGFANSIMESSFNTTTITPVCNRANFSSNEIGVINLKNLGVSNRDLFLFGIFNDYDDGISYKAYLEHGDSGGALVCENTNKGLVLMAVLTGGFNTEIEMGFNAEGLMFIETLPQGIIN